MSHMMKVQSKSNGRRRLKGYHPQLETVEARLPLGDAFLSTLLGTSWLGVSIALGNQSLLTAESACADELPASNWPSHDGTRCAQALDPLVGGSQAQGGHAASVIVQRESGDPRGSSAFALSEVDDRFDSSLAADPLQGFSLPRTATAARLHGPFTSADPAQGMHPRASDGYVASSVRAGYDHGSEALVARFGIGAAGLSSNPRAADSNYYVVSPPAMSSDSSADPAITSESDWEPSGGMPPPSGAVHALFDLSAPTSGPFPSNWFTVADRTQNTDKRINLPLPDCQTHPSDCEDVNVLNTLDGFNLQPRLSIPFDGPIDVNSVSSNTVFVVSLGDTLNHHDHGGQVVGINQVVWDVATTTLHAESDELLAQHTRYALIVTNGLHDTSGDPVEATSAFRHFRQDVHGEYKHELLDAIHAARRVGVRESDIVTASVFTTLSATAVLEKIRDQIHAATPEPAVFNLGLGGERTVFNRADVTGIHWEQQTGDDPPSFTGTNLNLDPLDIFPGAVGKLAFGKYVSPVYEVHPGEYIPPVGTRTGTPDIQGHNDIYFNLFLPSGPKPEGGWPVAIFGHGFTNNKQGSPVLTAASMAAHGIATIAINMVGHGFGPFGTLTVNQTMGDPVTFSAGGRGIDQDGDHVIGNNEGLFAAPPRTIIWNTDGRRQTAVDLMQLVRVIQVGMAVEGDGGRDLDPSRIYYFGQSFGGDYGTFFLAVEPDVRSGVLNVAGGSIWSIIPLSPSARSRVGSLLATRVPSLINSPGITNFGGVPVAAPPYFNDNTPLKNGIPLAVRLDDGTDHIIQSPVINTVAGAMAIQEVIKNSEWVSQSGNPVAYAPHLRKNPLPGVPAKSVIIQFAKGDQTVPNPTETALLRAGDLADRTTFYRHDLAFAENPALPKDPHVFMTQIASPIPLYAWIARGAQEQIATFFASDGATIIHPDPAKYFEVPINLPLPEDLNYIP